MTFRRFIGNLLVGIGCGLAFDPMIVTVGAALIGTVAVNIGCDAVEALERGDAS